MKRKWEVEDDETFQRRQIERKVKMRMEEDRMLPIDYFYCLYLFSIHQQPLYPHPMVSIDQYLGNHHLSPHISDEYDLVHQHVFWKHISLLDEGIPPELHLEVYQDDLDRVVGGLSYTELLHLKLNLDMKKDQIYSRHFYTTVCALVDWKIARCYLDDIIRNYNLEVSSAPP